MDTGAYLNSVFGLKGKVILITGAAGIWKSAER